VPVDSSLILSLCLQYPWKTAVEWEQLYLSRRPDFIHLIGIATETLEEEGDSDLNSEIRQEKVVEELSRCEILGLDKNLVAWNNLEKLVSLFTYLSRFRCSDSQHGAEHLAF
jgi:hypothetical protein